MPMSNWKVAASTSSLLVAIGAGCIPIGATMAHTPALATNVGKLAKGQTTRAEVLQLFGDPDIQAVGAESRANPNMPIFKGYRQLGLAAEAARLWPYSSIDPEEEAFFYIEWRLGGGLAFLPLPYGGVVGGNVSHAENKLLVLIDRRTGVVREFWYRQGFSVDSRP
jgi:hypothetical protein